MLGHTYRYQVYNSSAVTIAVTLKSRPFKFASDGSRTDAAEATHFTAQNVAAGAYGTMAAPVDNASVKNLFDRLVLTGAPTAPANGVLQLFLQHSTDGGTTWPSDGRGILVGSIGYIGSSTSVSKNVNVGG